MQIGYLGLLFLAIFGGPYPWPKEIDFRFAAVAVSRDDLVNTRSRSLSSRSMFSNDKTPATVTTSGGQFKPEAIQLGQKCVIL